MLRAIKLDPQPAKLNRDISYPVAELLLADSKLTRLRLSVGRVTLHAHGQYLDTIICILAAGTTYFASLWATTPGILSAALEPFCRCGDLAFRVLK